MSSFGSKDSIILFCFLQFNLLLVSISIDAEAEPEIEPGVEWGTELKADVGRDPPCMYTTARLLTHSFLALNYRCTSSVSSYITLMKCLGKSSPTGGYTKK